MAAVRNRPFAFGLVLGVLLPGLLLLVLGVAGRAGDYFHESSGYGLIVWFAPLGIATLGVAWRLFERLDAGKPGAGFALGLLLSGSFVGMGLVWASAAERPLGNRLVFSVSGGPLVLGFWLWLGAILGYAVAQSRRPPRPSA